MKSLRNSVQLIGRLGKDPEAKTFDSGSQKVSFTLATSDTIKNQKGDRVEETQWHNIVIWGKQAETAGKYLKKGTEVVIEGRLVHRSYETPAGEKKYFTEINVNDFMMVGSKPQ